MEFSSQPLKLYTEINNPCTLLLTPLHPRGNTSGIYKGTSFSAEGCLRPPPPKKRPFAECAERDGSNTQLALRTGGK